MEHAAQQLLVAAIDGAAIGHHHLGAGLLVQQLLQVRVGHRGDTAGLQHVFDGDWSPPVW